MATNEVNESAANSGTNGAEIMQPSTKKRITATEFVKIFQECNNYEDVAEKTESTVANVKTREAAYRKMNIPLKVYEQSKKKRGLDVDALTKLAKELAGTKS